ncbi:hypothetical protein, partial [Streptomyces sp. NPDC007070]|uniref:hypothetical protein n=1 Tax=Streptomyces sp. NPDC007070 TaxID=3154312 RepID=UPI00340DB84B
MVRIRVPRGTGRTPARGRPAIPGCPSPCPPIRRSRREPSPGDRTSRPYWNAQAHGMTVAELARLFNGEFLTTPAPLETVL